MPSIVVLKIGGPPPDCLLTFCLLAGTRRHQPAVWGSLARPGRAAERTGRRAEHLILKRDILISALPPPKPRLLITLPDKSCSSQTTEKRRPQYIKFQV